MINTIRMPKTTLDKWLAALRSGDYTQAVGKLEFNGGYCCLGVLQCVVDGAVEKAKTEYDAKRYAVPIGEPMSLPTREWMEREGISTKYSANNANFAEANNLYIYREPYDEDDRTCVEASVLNDEEHKTFKEIADLVEACTETY